MNLRRSLVEENFAQNQLMDVILPTKLQTGPIHPLEPFDPRGIPNEHDSMVVLDYSNFYHTFLKN